MRILQLHFCLLLWWGATDGFRDLLVDLGQNVSLGCEIDVKDVNWILVKPSYHLVHILRSFASYSTEAQHSDPAFRERFSLQLNSTLFIQNITVNELGVYYCISSQKSSNGTRLYTKLPEPDHSNLTKNQTSIKQDENFNNPSNLQIFLIVSAMANLILVILVTGLAVQYCKRTPKLQPQPPDSTARSSTQQQEESSGAQYEEIELPSNSMRVIQVNGTYALLQKPKPQRRGA